MFSWTFPLKQKCEISDSLNGITKMTVSPPLLSQTEYPAVKSRHWLSHWWFVGFIKIQWIYSTADQVLDNIQIAYS